MKTQLTDILTPEQLAQIAAINKQLSDQSRTFDSTIKPVWEWTDNDDGRGQLFLEHFFKEVRYVPELNRWRVWNGQRWEEDTGQTGWLCQLLGRHQVDLARQLKNSLADTLASNIKSDTKEGELTEDQIKKLIANALRLARILGQEKPIAALLAAASRDPRIIVPLAEWDADPWQAGVRNGVLDLRNQTHRPTEPHDYITKRLDVHFEASVVCPEWLKFLDRIIPSVELRDYLQKLVGYTLTGCTDDHAFYFLYGSGKNGKSIFTETVSRLMGDYGQPARRQLIEENANKDPKHDLARLPGVRYLSGEELSSKGKLREDVIKSLTAGDEQIGEAKYGTPFDFHPITKLWLMGNHRPAIEGTNLGIWRRVRLIPFSETISDEELIPASELLATFERERAGILNWALAGLKLVSPSCVIAAPNVVAEATQEYRDSEDVIGEFLTENVREGKKTLLKSELYSRYESWADKQGFRSPLPSNKLTRKLKERGGWAEDAKRVGWRNKELITASEDGGTLL